jgi:hypothetical protein
MKIINKTDLKEIAKNTKTEERKFRGYIPCDIMNKALEDTAQRLLFKFYEKK